MVHVWTPKSQEEKNEMVVLGIQSLFKEKNVDEKKKVKNKKYQQLSYGLRMCHYAVRRDEK